MQWALTIGGTTYRGRPLSAEAVRVSHRELVECGEDAGAQSEILARLLRKSFPLAWANLWSGDPVRQVVRAPNRDALVAKFLALPPKVVEPVREPDEWDKLEAMQRIPDEGGGPAVTLDTVCRLTEHAMGAGWYYHPDRWPTWDGYAPYDVVWTAWGTLQQARAFERLNMIRSIGVAKAGERATALYDGDVREALGG